MYQENEEMYRKNEEMYRKNEEMYRKNEEMYQRLLGEKDARMREKDESNMKLLSKTIEELAHANTEIFAIQGIYLSNDSNGSIGSFTVCMDLGVLPHGMSLISVYTWIGVIALIGSYHSVSSLCIPNHRGRSPGVPIGHREGGVFAQRGKKEERQGAQEAGVEGRLRE
jgi:hypothetical protein